MATDGADMPCVDCHTAEKHQMLGKAYSRLLHEPQPRGLRKLPRRGAPRRRRAEPAQLKVACQTCHIPDYAKVNRDEDCAGTGPPPGS